MNPIEFEMRDLLPIVNELVEKYTSKESSSVTYECAQYLMEAVKYTIHENEDEEWIKRECGQSAARTSLIETGQKISAREAYENGKLILAQKVEHVRECFNQLSGSFCSYDNENIVDTVMKGIPGFLQYFDLKFAPQNEILTKDYPVLCEEELSGLCGIDVIVKYLDAICIDQQFLQFFPEVIVKQVLKHYHSNYEEMMINLCEPMLYHVLGCLIAHKKIEQVEWTNDDYDRIEEYVLTRSTEQSKQELTDLLYKMLLAQKNIDVEKMKTYLNYGVESFSRDLTSVVKNNCINRLFAQDFTMIDE